MKIVISTFYNADNYGAYLQANGTYTYLKNKGHSVCFEKLEFSKNSAEKQPFYAKMNQFINKEVEENFVVNNSNEEFDLAIMGSDEIWNLSNTLSLKNYKFFGKGINSKQKISYSPTAIGTSKKQILKWFNRTRLIKKFDGVSVRDKKSKELLNLFGVKNVEITLDPTFLINYDDITKRVIKEKYLFVYSYGINETLKTQIIDYAKNNGLKIVVSGSPCDWADYNEIVPVKDWLSLVKFAECVVTTTFHGSVFSLIFNKNFIMASQTLKAIQLLEQFEIPHRITDDVNMLNNKIDYDKVNELIEKYTKSSKEYLDKFIR